MKKGKPEAGKFKELRARAEKDLKKQIEKIQKESKGDFKRVLHELRVHQIELEMQNEELRRAQQELEESRNKYSDLYDFAPAGYFTFDKNGVIIEANLAGCRMLGVERAALIKKSFHTFVAKESQDRFYLHRQAVTKTQARQTCEVTVIRKDGDKFSALLESIPVTDAKSDFIHIRMAITDITERKQAEEALKVSEKRYRSLLDLAPDSILVSQDGHIVYCNAAAVRLYGAENAEQLTGTKCLDRVHPDQREMMRARVQSILDGREAALSEFRQLRLDGREIPVETMGGPVDWQGKPAVQAIVRDISERKKAEEELKKITEELNRSNKGFEEFAQLSSHDLREPLRAVAGFVQLLEQRYVDKLDNKAKEYIKFATDGAKKMDELISGLLECSRVQTRGTAPHLIPGRAALRTAIENLHYKIAEAQADVTFDELPEFKADGSQFTQVLQNLIDNAIKFHGDKKPKIHVGCKKSDDGWHFSVHDNGIGIDKQYHERIFKIFQRLHTQDKFPGYGVGLTICQKIVERHGGRIWVESEQGKGATFYFTIPQGQ